MFNRIIDWAVINRLLVVIALITLTVSAVFIIPKLNLDAFPDVTNVQVSVNTEAPGWLPKRWNSLLPIPSKRDVRLTGCGRGALNFQNRPVRRYRSL